MKPQTVHLAATLLLSLAAAASARPTRAQIASPNIVAAPPKPPTRQTRKPTDPDSAANLQWLWQYAQPAPNGNAAALRFDPRLETLLQTALKQPQAMWGQNVPIAEVVPRFLARYGAVTVEGDRYLTIDGCVPSFCPAHGLLWIDLGSPHPLIVFAAVNWTSEAHATGEAAADYNLWLFPNRDLAADALPFALTQSLAHWDVRLAAAHRLVPHIAHALLVAPNGTPTPLDPSLIGANTLPPQPDTVTPKDPDSN